MSRYDLLPPNATPLERNLSRAVSTLDRIARPVPIIRTAKRVNIPESVVPWLIFEYGLGELLPFITNQRRLVAEGVLWQRIRGTPESIRIGLTWLDLDGYIEESERGTRRWAEFMIGLDAGVSADTIDRIVGISRIASPVRSRLQRIFAVYDFRRFVLSDSLLSDGGILSDHSGTRPRPDWPQISFGDFRSESVDAEPQLVSGALTYYSPALVAKQDRFILSQGQLDEEWHVLNYPLLMSEEIGLSGGYTGQVWGPFHWSDETWVSLGAIASVQITTLTE